MTLEEARANIGRGVIWQPGAGRREYGSISSVNDRWVFVLYEGGWQAKATNPALLSLLTPGKPR